MARHTKSKVNLINKSYFAELLLENCKQFVRVFLLTIFCFIGNHFTRSPDISWAHTDRSRSFSVSFQLDLKFWSGVKDWKFRLMKTISFYTRVLQCHAETTFENMAVINDGFPFSKIKW